MKDSKRSTVCISNETWCKLNTLRTGSQETFEDVIIKLLENTRREVK